MSRTFPLTDNFESNPSFSCRLLPGMILLLQLFLSSCATAPLQLDVAAVPQEDNLDSSYLEKKLGEGGFYFVVLNYKLMDDMQLLNRLERIGARIVAYTERPEIRYKYAVINSNYHNAISLPDGYIVLTRGLLEAITQEEEIAGILAHEIAHITHKHGVKLYEHQEGKSFSTIVGEKVFKIAADVHYKQAMELQADQTGLRYLRRAGYDAEKFLALLAKVKELEAKDQIIFEQAQKDNLKHKKTLDKYLMADHPLTENRIVNARAYLPDVLLSEEVKYNEADFIF